MKQAARGLWVLVAGVGFLTGCPGVQQPVEYIAGSTGDAMVLGDQASVEVLSPQSDLTITGGTPVEATWRATFRTRISTVDVIVDLDTDPDNGNEIVAYENLSITQSSALVDTTALDAGTYRVGVLIREVGEIVAYDYSGGRLVLNQRPRLYFTAPRNNYRFDRTPRINPSFDVAWVVTDPDSTVTTRIYLDPDASGDPDGDEILLRTGATVAQPRSYAESFSFDLPTANFEAGTYRILAIVSDGSNDFAYYAPASIRLRQRLAGYIDLRDLHLPTSPVPGAVFEGFNPRDNAGSFVSSLRDLDSDGFDDVIMLAQFGKPNYESNIHRTGVGEAYLIYGRSTRFNGVINLNSTGVLFRGEVFCGVPEAYDPIRPSRGITSFALLSDWDRDTVRELAFGLPFTDSVRADVLAVLDPDGYFRTGAVIIASASVLRPDLGFPGGNIIHLGHIGTLPHVPLKELNPPPPEGFVGPKASLALAGGGGVTLFHEHLVNPAGAEITLGGRRLGCRISTNDVGDCCGETISSWDFDSIIISVPNRDPGVATLTNIGTGRSIPGAGVVSIYYCEKDRGFHPWWEDNAPAANTDFNYPGMQASIDKPLLPHGGPYHYIIDDFRLYPLGSGRWSSGSPGYLVDPDDAEPWYLTSAGGAPNEDVTTRIWGEQPGGRTGNAIGMKGDFNADGIRDILIGSPMSHEGAGACFIVLGRLRDLMRGGELRIEELGLPMDASGYASNRILDGIRVIGNRGDRLGQSQDDAGDFNNDGIADVVIGSPLLNQRRGGAAVFFGSRDVINLTQEEIPFNEIPSRGLGVIFVGEEEGDMAGMRVASAGDVDGDGNDDLLIAAPHRSVKLDIDLDGTLEIDRTDCGVVYLIYGSPSLSGTISLSLTGTERLPGAVFIGRNSGEQLAAGLGEHGDRSYGMAGAGDIDGDGFGDLLLGSVRASPRDRERAGEVYLIYGVGEPAGQ